NVHVGTDRRTRLARKDADTRGRTCRRARGVDGSGGTRRAAARRWTQARRHRRGPARGRRRASPPTRSRPRAAAKADEVKDPTFSVVIAAYQAAGTIGDAIESALAQTHPPVEIIVSDDGSSDDLEGALAPYRERIVVLKNEHRGPGAARNAALRRATGEFVAILDADDVFEPGRLAALAGLAKSRPELDILATDAVLERVGKDVGRFYREDFR